LSVEYEDGDEYEYEDEDEDEDGDGGDVCIVGPRAMKLKPEA
jgi:hypothetical protein